MSKTKIILEHPYDKDWKAAYLVVNKENRKTLILYNNNKNRSSTQYARYLMSVKLKRYLTKEETVDHIDGDKTNDDISNLQVLTMTENIRKSHKLPDIKLICPVCNNTFLRSRSFLRGKKDRAAKNMIACSRICGGKLSHVTKNK